MRYLLYLRELIKQEKISDLLKVFNTNESLDRIKLEELQLSRLTDLLHYLNQYNLFYSQLLKDKNNDFNKSNKMTLGQILNLLPIVDKSFIKKNTSKWLTTNVNAKITSASTSGSTGVPFEIFHSSISRDIKAANKFRLFKWHGVKRWDKQLYFGCTYGPPKKLSSKIKIAVNNKYVWNKQIIDFTIITDDKLKHVVDKINSEKPVSIWGYPSVIIELALYILKNNLTIRNEKLKMIILSGESHNNHIKDMINKAFSIYPVDEYNANEGFIAGSCEYGKLHLMEDTLIAEVLNEDGSISDFGYGELLITYLYSFDFPFIRYKIGDIVNISKEKCKCGRSFKVIDSVDGRKGSVIYNGEEKISNATCNHYVTKSTFIDTIEKYQIVQNELSAVIIKLVVSDKSRDYSGFEITMKGLFNNLKVTFEYVDDIPRQKSGKHIDVLNNIHKQ